MVANAPKNAAAESATKVARVSNQELAANVGERFPFPKYAIQIINLTNQHSQATRPRNVGQMSELIQAFPGKSYVDWTTWYER